MTVRARHIQRPGTVTGFTLVEVIMSIAILALVIQGVLLGYVQSTRWTVWSAHSLAAQSLASQGAEQARSARWDPQQWPQGIGPGLSDELGETNYMQTNTLDVPINGKAVIATNFITVATASTNPPLRQIRSDCVWEFMGRGLFTNSVILLRAPDQ